MTKLSCIVILWIWAFLLNWSIESFHNTAMNVHWTLQQDSVLSLNTRACFCYSIRQRDYCRHSQDRLSARQSVGMNYRVLLTSCRNSVDSLEISWLITNNATVKSAMRRSWRNQPQYVTGLLWLNDSVARINDKNILWIWCMRYHVLQ